MTRPARPTIEVADPTPASSRPLRASSLFSSYTSVLFGNSLVRFLAVGGLSAAVDGGALWLLHGVLGVWLPVATFTGVALAFVVNFLLSRSWVFAARGSAYRQLGRYLSLAVANWAITVTAVTGLAALGTHYLVARVAILVVMTVVNFLAYRRWVFRTPSGRTEAAETV